MDLYNSFVLQCLLCLPANKGGFIQSPVEPQKRIDWDGVRKKKSSIFYGQTTSVCEVCLHLVPTKIYFESNKVFFYKRCDTHGETKTLISTDIEYFKSCKNYFKPPDLPLLTQTKTIRGCPYDCGLCPDHEQHSCLAIIEINQNCNLSCPVCFAESSPSFSPEKNKNVLLSRETFEKMLDTLVASEGEPDLLQISGGEPTLHPEILDFISLAKKRPIRHIMLNTNGLRIAREEDFVRELAKFKPGFEVYLQFDSLNSSALKNIRGADLVEIRRAALQNLEKYKISTTLVVVVKKGINDQELGSIIEYALDLDCVRGVTFQPVQDVGRNLEFKSEKNRIVLSEIRESILAQTKVFEASDLIPLPCNPESIAIGYGLKSGKSIFPVTRWLSQEELIKEGPNTITYEKYPELKNRVFELFSLSTAEGNSESKLKDLLCCLPQYEIPSDLGYDKVFRVVIMSFLDRYNFCIAQVKRSCVHFVTPDLKIIPFDTYNMFYRDKYLSQQREKQND